MPFNRTLRRKIVFGLSLVLVMLITLSVGALSSLSSYRQVVIDLDFSINEAPRRSDLVSAVGILLKPFRVHPDRRIGPRFRKHQQELFNEQLLETRDQLLEYSRKLDALPPTPEFQQRRPVTEGGLREIHRRLELLEKLQAGLTDPAKAEAATESMVLEIGSLLALIEEGIPDYQHGLNEKLQSARKSYGSRFRFLCWTTGIGIVLFFLLVRYTYTAIFAPLRKLHQGALRVAQGDFDFRVLLSTRDEMAELADAFNQMTARFQEIACDLDRKVRERSKQLVRSERLAGLGFLAAGVAHEINNPLQAIMVAAESIEGRAPEFLQNASPADAEVIRQYLAMIRGEAFRCRDITARLLNFSRGQDATRTRHDLNGIIAEVLALVGHLSKFRDRKIEFTPGPPCWLVVNGPEIKQVILNLVSNALESMNSGGLLRIGVAEQTDQVVVTFQDQGIGMTPEVIDNLFEPFFTQRRDGKGTGLGLSISHRIITDHGGTIDATSDGPGKGSTFEVHLPRRAAQEQAA